MRQHPTLIVFGVSALAVFGAMAWVTRHALSLEHQRIAARAEAQVQEKVRLALWRMDSKASVLIARESARPYFEYQPFHATDRAYTRMLEEVRPGEVLVPSPLLAAQDRVIQLYFQVDSKGVATSPQAPTGNLRDLAETSYISADDVIAAGERLKVLDVYLRAAEEDRAQRAAIMDGVPVRADTSAVVQASTGEPEELEVSPLIGRVDSKASGLPHRNESRIAAPWGIEAPASTERETPEAAVRRDAAKDSAPQPPPGPVSGSASDAEARGVHPPADVAAWPAGEGVAPASASGTPPPSQLSVQPPATPVTAQPATQSEPAANQQTSGPLQQSIDEYRARVTANAEATDNLAAQTRAPSPKGAPAPGRGSKTVSSLVAKKEAEEAVPQASKVAADAENKNTAPEADVAGGAPPGPAAPGAPVGQSTGQATGQLVDKSVGKSSEVATAPSLVTPLTSASDLDRKAKAVEAQALMEDQPEKQREEGRENQQKDPTPTVAGTPVSYPAHASVPPPSEASFTSGVDAAASDLYGTSSVLLDLAKRQNIDTDDDASVSVGAFGAGWVCPGGNGTTSAADEAQLVFLRDVRIGNGDEFRQGFWVDWPVWRADLLAAVKDLLPNADVRPVTRQMALGQSHLERRLASFPAEVIPGEVPIAAAGLGVNGNWSPLHNTLVLAWVGVLLAIAAIAFLLRAATDLAERRGRFVSAVTHELRTPLTTFVMYSQMLADGMVPEGEARQHYYTTLKREAGRLAGIVENVLEFARLSRGKRTQKTSATTSNGSLRAGELLERLVVPLRQRVEQVGGTLDAGVEGSEEDAGKLIATEELTLERILFNLVDNACKYGATPGDASTGAPPPCLVTLRLRLEGAWAVFTVSDNGPGIAPLDRARIFKAFERGTKQADGSIPGLGLGLALSKGLAKDLGGDLILMSAVPATFEVRVPR